MAESTIATVDKKPAFPERVDHVYCVSIDGSEASADAVYIGQSVTPGRALKHFKSHNEKLQKRLSSHETWKISFQQLSEPSAEDLNIFECLAIDLISHDHRFNSLNGSKGAKAFMPRVFDPLTNLAVQNTIYVLWESVDGGDRAIEVTDIAPMNDPSASGLRRRWWATPPLRHENVNDVLAGIRSLLESSDSQQSGCFPNAYFQYLEDMGLDARYALPAAGTTVSLAELYDELAGSFVYVQINDTVFDEVGATRTGLKPGLGHESLKDRIEKYWSTSSSSLTPGRTIRELADPIYRAALEDSEIPRYLVGAVSGTKIVLGIWTIDTGTEASWMDLDEAKMVFPLSGTANRSILEKFVGARINQDLALYQKAVKWIDVAP